MSYFSNKPYLCMINLKRNHSLTFNNSKMKSKKIAASKSILKINNQPKDTKITLSSVLFENSMMIIGEEQVLLLNRTNFPRIMEQHVKSYFLVLNKNDEIIMKLFKKMLLKYMKHLDIKEFLLVDSINKRMIIG